MRGISWWCRIYRIQIQLPVPTMTENTLLSIAPPTSKSCARICKQCTCIHRVISWGKIESGNLLQCIGFIEQYTASSQAIWIAYSSYALYCIVYHSVVSNSIQSLILIPQCERGEWARHNHGMRRNTTTSHCHRCLYHTCMYL